MRVGGTRCPISPCVRAVPVPGGVTVPNDIAIVSSLSNFPKRMSIPSPTTLLEMRRFFTGGVELDTARLLLAEAVDLAEFPFLHEPARL